MSNENEKQLTDEDVKLIKEDIDSCVLAIGTLIANTASKHNDYFTQMLISHRIINSVWFQYNRPNLQLLAEQAVQIREELKIEGL